MLKCQIVEQPVYLVWRNGLNSKFDKFFGVSVDPLVEVEEKPKNPTGKKKVPKQKIQSKTLFDHLKAIFNEPYNPKYFQELTEPERRTFTPYMIHRFISSYESFDIGVQVANHGQLNTRQMPPDAVYKFYHSLLNGQAQWNWNSVKYVKGEEQVKYNKELLELISKHLWVSKKEACDYLDILYHTNEGKDAVKEILEMYAYDDKQINKLMEIGK